MDVCNFKYVINGDTKSGSFWLRLTQITEYSDSGYLQFVTSLITLADWYHIDECCLLTKRCYQSLVICSYILIFYFARWSGFVILVLFIHSQRYFDSSILHLLSSSLFPAQHIHSLAFAFDAILLKKCPCLLDFIVFYQFCRSHNRLTLSFVLLVSMIDIATLCCIFRGKLKWMPSLSPFQ